MPRPTDPGTDFPDGPVARIVTMYCAHADSSTVFEVLPAAKQVAKVPSGAPQTGGTDGPVDGSGRAAADPAAEVPSGRNRTDHPDV
ncbi:hypothetical protein ACWEF6_38100 [Amycolatopsis sp. NPDC004772]